MGLVIAMTMRFYHILMSRIKSGKPAGQSLVAVIKASKVGPDVVEVGIETKVEVTEPPCSPMLLATKGVRKVSFSRAEPKCTDM